MTSRAVVFDILDGDPGNVAAPREAGWHAVHHVDTHGSIVDLRQLLQTA